MRSFDLTTHTPWLRRLLVWMAVALIASGMLTAFATCSRELAASTGPAHVYPVLGALVSYLAYCLLNAFGWTLVLRLLRARIESLAGITLWLRCEACRWIPGSVWNLGARSVAVTRYKIPLGVGTASLIIELGFTLVSWFALASCATIVYFQPMREGMRRLPPEVWQLAPWLVMGLLIGTFVAVVWRLLGKSEKQGGLLGAVWLVGKQPSRALGLACYYVLINALNGLALYCLVLAWNPTGDVPVLAVIGANAIAWMIGFFVIIAPGGIIVREATLSIVLMNWMPSEQALSIAVAWRMLQLAGEIFLLTAVNLPSFKSSLESRSS